MNNQKKKVMIVDDQEMIRRLVKMTLAGEGYDVYEAVDGMEAMNLAEEQTPDLIILDVMMPGLLDGMDVCRKMREKPELKDTIILFLSARAQEVDKEEGMFAGATDYLIKPFSPEYLLQVVHQYLEDLPTT